MGLLIVDKSQNKAFKGQQLLDIDQNEFDILWILSSRPERIFSEEDIELELEQEYLDFKGFSIIKIIKTLQEKLSFQNILLVDNDGFKIEFKRAI
jgi:DNA-binding response OmpR family regulator